MQGEGESAVCDRRKSDATVWTAGKGESLRIWRYRVLN